MTIIDDARDPGLSCYGDESMQESLTAFVAAYPAFASTYRLDELRATEYSRLDQQRQIYLDYTGGGLYAASQITHQVELLTTNVLGNPHSHNPSSLATTYLVEQARAAVLEYFHASPDQYDVVFTANASNAIKLVGEAYPFGPGGRYALTADNHNSVNGIREFARAKGAHVMYVPVVAPAMRLDEDAMTRTLEGPHCADHNLLAYPAQSNFSGVQHSLEWIARAQDAGWDVLLDAAAFVPTNRLDLSIVQPDFMTLSFYKMFGYPTGVGALIARRQALAKLNRPWFAGGTVTIASVKGDGFFLIDGGAGFEDGTINYLLLPAVQHGLAYLSHIGIGTIHVRVSCLSGWLLESLIGLRHTNGQPMVKVLGPTTNEARGGTIAFNFHDPAGRPIHDRRVEELANDAGISLRTGCFCNPGAGEIAHGVTVEQLRTVFEEGVPLSFAQLHERLLGSGTNLNAIRVSVGLATTFADVYRFMGFASGLRDKTTTDLGKPRLAPPGGDDGPDTP